MKCAAMRSSSKSLPPASANRTCTMCRSPRKHRITTLTESTTLDALSEPQASSATPQSPAHVPPAAGKHQKILILDFGSQVTQLIARRIREIGVYCEIHPHDMPEQ